MQLETREGESGATRDGECIRYPNNRRSHKTKPDVIVSGKVSAVARLRPLLNLSYFPLWRIDFRFVCESL